MQKLATNPSVIIENNDILVIILLRWGLRGGP